MMINDDIIAKIYDPFLYLALKSIRIAVMNELLKYKDKTILDLCCGTGNQLKLLSKHGFKNLHCLDISNSMLEIARKHCYHINIYNEDATKTSFITGSIDIAIISFALHEKDRTDQVSILNEAHRLIKEDGFILVVDYNVSDKIPGPVKTVINIIERIAGKEHYHNFKSYLRNSGLSSLINKDRFKLVNYKRKLFNAVAIGIIKKCPYKKKVL